MLSRLFNVLLEYVSFKSRKITIWGTYHAHVTYKFHGVCLDTGLSFRLVRLYPRPRFLIFCLKRNEDDELEDAVHG